MRDECTYDFMTYANKAFLSDFPQTVVHKGEDRLSLAINDSIFQNVLWAMVWCPPDLLGVPGSVCRAVQNVSVAICSETHVDTYVPPILPMTEALPSTSSVGPIVSKILSSAGVSSGLLMTPLLCNAFAMAA